MRLRRMRAFRRALRHSRIEPKTINKSANESKYSSACSLEIVKEWYSWKYAIILSLKFWLNLYCISRKLKFLKTKKPAVQIAGFLMLR